MRIVEQACFRCHKRFTVKLDDYSLLLMARYNNPKREDFVYCAQCWGNGVDSSDLTIYLMDIMAYDLIYLMFLEREETREVFEEIISRGSSSQSEDLI